jgi:DNA-binding NtrC family response regulator/tetratricopeptide (TPR) repeat protein/predicted transcriptional regulator
MGLAERTQEAKPERFRVLGPVQNGSGLSAFRVADAQEGGMGRILTLGEGDPKALAAWAAARIDTRHPHLVPIAAVSVRGRRVGLVTDSPGPAGFQLTASTSPFGSRMIVAHHLIDLLRFVHSRGLFAGVLGPWHLYGRDCRLELLNFVWPTPVPEVSGVSTDEVLRYAAPELAETEPSPETDCYSLGMLLYHLFTGIPPFEDTPPEHLNAVHLAVELRRPRSLCPDLPDPVEQVIQGLVRKDPERRMTLRAAAALLQSSGASFPDSPGPLLSAPLLGRDVHLQRFRALLDSWRLQPRAQVLILAGPPGSGKSALLERLGMNCRLAGLQVASVHHREGEERFQAFADPHCSWWNEGVGDCPDVAPEVIQGTLQRFFSTAPLVLVVGALHLASPEAIQIYAWVLASNAPVLLLAEWARESPHRDCSALLGLSSQTGSLQYLELTPLSRSEMLEVVRQVLSPSVSPRLQSSLASYSGGSPGFLMAALEELRARNDLHYRTGGWACRADLESSPELEPPERMVRATSSLLGTLSSTERMLLEYLALLRKATELRVLARLAGRPAAEVESGLQELTGLGIVSVEGTLSQPRYELSQPWLADAVEQLLPVEAKAERIGRILSLSPAQGLDLVDIARFSLAAGDVQLVQEHLFPAIDELTDKGRHRQALGLLQKAAERELVRPSDWPVLRRLVQTSFQAGRLESCWETIHQALKGIMNGDQRAFLLSSMARIHLARKAHVDGATTLRRAYSLAPSGSALQTGILGDLLTALSHMGISAASRRVAFQVLRILRSRASVAWRDRLFHAVYRFTTATLSELSDPALHWESKSVRTAAREGSVPAHRLCLLARHHLRSGRWKQGLALTEWVQALAVEIESPKLEVWLLSLRALAARKRGRHQDAQHLLEEAIGIGSQLQWGLELEYELRLQLARNACHQLALADTFHHLDQLGQLRARSCLDADPSNLQLLQGWCRLQVGDSEGALNEVQALLRQGHQRDVRVRLLHSACLLRLGNLHDAQDAARNAKLSAGQLEWYVGRARLQQAEIALAEQRFTQASALARGVLLQFRAGWSEPLQCRGHLIKSRCLLETNQLPAARAQALRAWQLARGVERPGLRGEIGRILAEIAIRERELAVACEWLLRVLDPLEEQAVRLSEDLRDGFRRRHIVPLEELLLQIGQSGPKVFAGRLGLARFSSELKESAQEPGLLRGLAECLAAQLRNVAFALFVRIPGSDGMRLEHTRGNLACCPRPVDLKSGPKRAPIIQRRRNLTLALLPLVSGIQTEGFLHLELPGCMTESEADLVRAACTIAELYLSRGVRQSTDVARAATAVRGCPYVGDHPTVQALLVDAGRFAGSEGTILITGETGTGKEVMARLIHAQSKRRNGPFVPINCAALPGELIESELFGHAAGSFTGASRPRPGLFETASRGTLFLDEISSMPTSLQPRLLRVLQERRVRRVGENQERPVDVRVIAASNQELRRLVEEGLFRSDLYHRLHVLSLPLPPLRHRRSDIPLLARHFLEKLSGNAGHEFELSEPALRLLEDYRFPGNVRELENILESLALTSADGRITEEAVRLRLQHPGMVVPAESGARVDAVVSALMRGESDFWKLVRDPFLNRNLSRDDVKAILARLLDQAQGSYRRLLQDLGLPVKDYKRLMNFLESHDCKVDFRPFRKRGFRTRADVPRAS